MRNLCKHKGSLIITSARVTSPASWHWCPYCGATRMDRHKYMSFSKPEVSKGKWKSPKIAIGAS